MTPDAYHAMIDAIFDACVRLLRDLAAMLGTTYEAVNVWLFVVAQPALILLFAALWLRAERRAARALRAGVRHGGPGVRSTDAGPRRGVET